MAITTSTTRAEVVTAHRGVARELERRGLDDCCGGRRNLVDARGIVELDLDEVLADLVAVSVGSPPADWTSMATGWSCTPGRCMTRSR